MKVGFVGLGPMGAPMATRLAAAGHELAVWNRTVERTEPLRAAGARVASTPADAARDAEIVVSIVANDAAVRAVALGPDGIADGLVAGAVHVCASTVSVSLARDLDASHRARDQVYLSGNVLGRPPAAAAGELFTIAAGDPASIDRAAPVLAAWSRHVFRVGTAPWQANLVKLLANFMIFSTIEQLAEVFALGAKAGIAEATIFDVLGSTFCNAPVHLNYGRLIVERQFSPPGGAMEIGRKDTALLLEAGNEFGVPLPIASLLRDRFLASLAKGEANLDFAAISRRARNDAGLPN